jgi:hypothetical protein
MMCAFVLLYMLVHHTLQLGSLGVQVSKTVYSSSTNMTTIASNKVGSHDHCGGCCWSVPRLTSGLLRQRACVQKRSKGVFVTID